MPSGLRPCRIGASDRQVRPNAARRTTNGNARLGDDGPGDLALHSVPAGPFWGGIVGALLGAVIGAIVVALLINGFSVPGRHHTHFATSLDAIPGALLGIAAVYYEGVRRGYEPLDL